MEDGPFEFKMYFLLKMVIFQPAMLVYQRIFLLKKISAPSFDRKTLKPPQPHSPVWLKMVNPVWVFKNLPSLKLT